MKLSRKIALFGTIPESAVFCSYNAETVYQVPLILDKQGMGDFICQRLGHQMRRQRLQRMATVRRRLVNPEHEVKIALVGKYAGLTDSYVSMTEALRHGGAACKTKVCITYLEAEKLEHEPNASKTSPTSTASLFPTVLVHEAQKAKLRQPSSPEKTTFPSLASAMVSSWQLSSLPATSAA